MSYEQRLREYTREKQEILSKGLTFKQYEIEIKRLAKKWRI